MDLFPKRPMGDSVKYSLFPTIREAYKTNSSIETFNSFAESYILKLSPYISQYIWHEEPFNLSYVSGQDDIPAHLEGVTCFGDNIEDEWFIVFLLLCLTEEEPELIVQVNDSDGEFLLIEAADFLPDWVDSDSSYNRVFIYRGSVHFIQPVNNPDHEPVPESLPRIDEGLLLIQGNPSSTVASSAIQQAIRKRIQGYPEKIKSFYHKAHCYIPAAIASILKDEPQLISEAVKNFYLRDPLDLKACRAMRYFPPETRVMSEVLFTKCLYAQLISQKYEPDACTGWNLPPINNALFKSHDLGMKLACGFEILVSKNKTASSSKAEDAEDVDFENDPRWLKFLSSLKEKGYFRGEIEGSRLHRQLKSQAKDFYLQPAVGGETSISSPPSAIKVLQQLESLSYSYEELKEAEQFLGPPDDDSWMNISIDQLDSTLASFTNKDVDQSDASSVIPQALKSFLAQSSGIEGVEFPRDGAKQKETKKKKKNVNLEPDSFTEAVSNILDFRVPKWGGDSDSSTMSGYSDEEVDEIELTNGPISTKCPDSKEMKQYMEQMDRELAETDIGQSFDRIQPGSSNGNSTDDIDEDADDFRPVDVDLTALKNILESFSSQSGLPGPAGNLFSSLGIQLPQDSDP